MPANQLPPRGLDVPTDVRRKLTRSGTSMTEAEWRALPEVARRRLHELPAESPLERRAYANLLDWLLQTFPV